MKIVEVLFSLTPGGAERFVVDLSNELSKTDDVTLLTLKDDKTDVEQRNFYKFDLCDRVNYVNLGLPDGFSIKSQWILYREIKNFNTDIVHINDKNLCKFMILPLFFLSKKVKFFMTIHNDLHNGYDSGFNKFVFNTLGRWKRIRFAALSQKNYIDMNSYYPSSKFKCIVNGRAPMVPTEKFMQVKAEFEKYRKSANTKIMLHVARFNSQKNQQLLINAFNKLVLQGLDVQLIILGTGFNSDEGRHLLSMAGDNVHYLGVRKNISDYMLNADIFCLSSIYEGMPITLLEASLAGVPCVSTPVCGSVDLILDRINGKLSKDFTLESYVDALQYVVKHYLELKDNALDMRRNSPYSMSECAKKYKTYFTE